MGTKHFTSEQPGPALCLAYCCSVTPQAHTQEQTAAPTAPCLLDAAGLVETGYTGTH